MTEDGIDAVDIVGVFGERDRRKDEPQGFGVLGVDQTGIEQDFHRGFLLLFDKALPREGRAEGRVSVG
jgi:hypothetical protein